MCDGERHQSTGWGALDLPCDVPLYASSTSDRYQTRYYDRDDLNYYRKFRTTDIDHVSTSPEGPATATIRGQSRFFETFDVRGDDSTITVTTIGTLWEVRQRVHGPPVLRVVGMAVEPYNGPATFSGRITTANGTQSYQNVSLDVPIELFLTAACEAAAH